MTLARPPADPRADADYHAFSRRVRLLTGIDLAGYKREQMERRLRSLAQRHGVSSLVALAELMQREPRVLAAFKDFFTINVSEFLRDPARWAELEQRVLPLLLGEATGRPLLIWSAGCSYGAEPYSLALLLEEAAGRPPYTIQASDIDETMLARAQRGTGFRESDLRHVSAARREAWFARQPDGGYAVREALKRHLRFRRQDLLRETPGRAFDLIVCRNVVIYFTDEAKQDLYRRLVTALRPGGVLFVGGAELLPDAPALGLTPIATSFYRKERAGGVRAS